ncbi:MAG TPA: hypothetical protein PK587_12945 [Syntrophales bacterium]|nr:hypothetical protein [Syntrophales bacterium]HPL64667.1 hypothetical protein [Syntrophales bacterium]
MILGDIISYVLVRPAHYSVSSSILNDSFFFYAVCASVVIVLAYVKFTFSRKEQ